MNDSTFYKELEELINKHSVENDNDTPDYILAVYMIEALHAFTKATKLRDRHKGVEEGKVEPINLNDKKPLSEI